MQSSSVLARNMSGNPTNQELPAAASRSPDDQSLPRSRRARYGGKFVVPRTDQAYDDANLSAPIGNSE
jgi:hypothetical protein